MTDLQQILLTQATAIQHLITNQSFILKSLSLETSTLPQKTKEIFIELEAENTKIYKLVGECGKLIVHLA